MLQANEGDNSCTSIRARSLSPRFNPTSSCDFNVTNTTSNTETVTYGIDYPSKRMMSVGPGQTRGLSSQMQGITYTFGLASNSAALLRVACN